MRNVLIFLLVLIIIIIILRTWKGINLNENNSYKVVVKEKDISDKYYKEESNSVKNIIGENTRIGKKVSFSDREDIRIFDTQMPPYTVSDLNYGPRQMDAIDRIHNPLRYPYKSVPQFQRTTIVEMDNLPFQVMGGAGRRGPALNSGYAPMINPPVSIDVGPQNIAPVNVSVRGGIGLPQQVGVIMKNFGNDNDIYPLYGRKRYPQDHKWDYYTTMGKEGVKLRVQNINNNQRFDELSSNDEVRVEGLKDHYRVIVYQTDFPQYI